MPYNDPHHVVKTSAQWDERAIEFWVVPRGCLCVELTPEGKTKIKIGEGNKFYSQLPYVNDMSDLENYYTKEEVDNIVTNINLMAIRSTDEYDTKNDLPTGGNKLGDVRFVKSSSPSIKTDPDVYLWNGSRWIYVGYELQDIDLSQYLKKDEFHELFDPVREKVEEMYPKMHTHENKNILDRIEEPYSTAEKEKLAGLENYDDTEIRELIVETGHTHPNKPVLDTITDDSLWSESDRTKFESLHNYDDTGVRNRLTDLESTAHTHSNKNILDQVTAAFTVEDKTKLDSLHNNEVFIGTDGMYGGREGLVPAPTIIDAGKFLCADGTWKAAGEIVYDFRGATASEDGTNGLVPAPLAGEQSYYLRGDGTWAKVKQGGDKYKAGDGIFILSGEVISDTFPFKAYSKSGHLSQYIIYGNTGGVGESMGGGTYGVNISVTDEHGNTSNTSIILPEKISFGDYIDYEKQVFVHMRTNVSSLVNTVDPNYRYRWAIRSNGNIARTDVGAYGESPQVTTLVELEPGTTYELYHACTYPAFSNYMNLNVYDVDQNRTRTMNFYDSTGKVPTIIALGPNEKYIRLTWEHCDWYPNTLIKVKAVETPITLPQIPLFPNSINTINVTNTIKPAEIYVEVAEPSEDDPDDPMSDFTGIIYNDGVLDITQEDPNALNELTVHFRESDKVITIPTYTLPIASTSTLGGIIVGENLTIDENGVLSSTGGGGVLYDAGDGIEFTYNHMIDMLFDRTAFLDSVTSVQRGTISKDAVTGAFTITATGNDAYTLPDRSSMGTVYSIQADPNTTYKLTWTSDDPTVHGNVFVFENGDIITMYLVDQATLNELTFITSSACQTLNFRFGVQNSGDSLTYSDIALYKITGDATINAKLGNGLEVDNNNDINVKLGDGLYFDADGAIAASGDNDYTAGEGIDIIGTTRPIDINYIRLDINNSRDNGRGHIIQFKNIRVLDTNSNSLQFSHASSIYGDGSVVEYGQNSRDESPQAMIEGRNKTCCTNFSLSKAPLKITFTLTSEISIANITAFSILTGSDYTERDPVSWDIYASNDGVTWYKIQEAHSPDVTTARSTWITNIPFVIPPDAVEVLPGVKTITAKIGDGLSFDENDAITVDEMTGASASADGAPGTVPAPLIGDETKFLRGDGTWQTVSGGTTYAAGQGIEIETDTVKTYEDLHFDYYAFKDKIQGVNNGSISFDIPNHALTISATNNYCYVFPDRESDGQLYKIPVEPNEDYLLTWEVNDTTIAGKVDVFENGDVTVGHYDPARRESAANQQFLFTTSSTAETIHIRPYVYDAGTSLTFSNFQLYHVIYDTSGKIINAKLGTGLSFDSNDAIELDNAIRIKLNCNNEPD